MSKNKKAVKWDGVYSPTSPVGINPYSWAEQNLRMGGAYVDYSKFMCPVCDGEYDLIITAAGFGCEYCDLKGKTAVELRDILTKYGVYERPDKPYVYVGDWDGEKFKQEVRVTKFN